MGSSHLKILDIYFYMEKINYIIGDATKPELQVAKGVKFIVHDVNNIGKWGKGFVLAISNRWSMPEVIYKKWAKENLEDLKESLGKIQVVPVELSIFVINLVSQDGIRARGAEPPVRYEAIRKGLQKTNSIMVKFKRRNPTLHMPRLGCSLAGGSWKIVENIIKDEIIFPVYVYDLYKGGDYNP